MLLSAAVSEFIKQLRDNKKASAKTVENYSHYLDKFICFSGDIPLVRLTPTLINDYKLHLMVLKDEKSGQKIKKTTQNYFLIGLRALLRYLESKSLATISVYDVGLSKTKREELKVLDPDQVDRILSCPDILRKDGLRDKALLEVLASSGLRVSELANLNYQDVNLSNLECKIIDSKRAVRSVSLSSSAVKWLDQYLKGRKDNFKPLFLNSKGRGNLENNGEKMRLTPRSIQRMVQKYARKAGIMGIVTPSVLRHSKAVCLVREGVELSSVQQILGHEHLSTTKVYQEFARRDGRKKGSS